MLFDCWSREVVGKRRLSKRLSRHSTSISLVDLSARFRYGDEGEVFPFREGHYDGSHNSRPRRYWVVSLNCRDEFPQTVGTDAQDRATPPGSEAERDRTTVRSLSRRDPSVWPPWLE
jgi:hypothetical protein